MWELGGKVMQVFKTYFKILKSQMVPILIYAVLFLGLTVMITSSIRVENTTFETSKVNTMVINEDGDNEITKGLLNYLGEYASYIQPGKNKEANSDALFNRKVVYILTIPKGFTESFIANGTVTLIKETVPNSAEALSIDNTINNYLNSAKDYLKYMPNISYEQLSAYVTKSLSEETKVTINVKETNAVTYSNSFNKNFFNYLGYILLSAYITGVSVVMFSFHGLDIRRRHTASPISNRGMNVQLILANLIFVFGFLLLFVIAGFVLNRDRIININTWLTLINAFAFALTGLSISYLVGITVKSRKAISAISTALSLGLAFISGMFVPQEFLGKSVLRVASFTPTFWYVKANNAIGSITSLRWSSVSSIVGYMAIQIGFAAAIISIALVVSKRKTQQSF